MFIRQMLMISSGFIMGLVSMYMAQVDQLPYSSFQRIPHFKESSSSMLEFGDPGPVNDMLQRSSYILSYSRRDRLAHWAGEHLTRESLQAQPDVDRSKSRFTEDDDVPALFRAHTKDYGSSGYDRGHLAPANDAKASQQALDETFLLSNIAPQVGTGFNRHYWAYLEKFCRSLTETFDDVYVYTGPLFLPKPAPPSSKAKFIMTYEILGDDANVPIPTHFFKVILAPDKSGKYHLGAFVLPNQAINSNTRLTEFQVNLTAIEKASGMNFFRNLDRSQFGDLCRQVQCTVQ